MRIESDGSDGTITIWPDEGNHSATVIVMHGLGDSADGWSSTAEALAQQYPYIKFLLPTAERLPVTINGGARIPAWFDITGLGEEHHATTPSIRPAAERIRKLFDAEVSSGIQPNRISLMGFSQGGAMAIYVGLQLPVDLKPAGVIALSGFIPDYTNLTVTDGLADVPVLQCHGTADPVVMYKWALKSKEYLTEKGLTNYTLKTYEGMAHSSCPEEIVDVQEFITSILPDAPELAIKPKAPSEMSVKELKAAIRKAGLGQQALGFSEKSEFVKLLEEYYASKN